MRVTPTIVFFYASVIIVASAGGAWSVLAGAVLASPAPIWAFSVAGLVTAILPQKAIRISGEDARLATWTGAIAISLTLACIVAVYAFGENQNSLGASLIVFSIGGLIGCIRALHLLEVGIGLDLQARAKHSNLR